MNDAVKIALEASATTKVVYAFDVDETLEVSGGPVKIADIVELRKQGHIVGLCGNYARVCEAVPGWENLFSFVGQGPQAKDDFLRDVKRYMTPRAPAHVFVGNDHARPKEGGWQSPDDARFAAAAGWEFVDETAFANGARRESPSTSLALRLAKAEADQGVRDSVEAMAREQETKERLQPFLSLCVIVRDAEATVGEMLRSALAVDGVDEVVVVDTGSVDGTRDVVRRALEVPLGIWGVAGGSVTFNPEFVGDRRVVLASFDWVDDFAAARNYAFSLATGVWRMYLDADDVLECRHPLIKAGAKRADGSLVQLQLGEVIRACAAKDPAINSIMLPYEYAAGDMHQDVFRAWRWKDGWTWQDEVHESVVAEPAESHRRVFGYINDVVVVHHRPDGAKSHARNKGILEAALKKPGLSSEKRGRLLYGYAMSQRIDGKFEEANAALEEVIERCPDTNFEVYAHRELVKTTAIDIGDKKRAIDLCGRFVARYPDLADSHEHLGWLWALLGHDQRAARSFDAAKVAGTRLSWSSTKEVWFDEGAAPAAAACAYAHVGRLADAEEALARVKSDRHEYSRPFSVEARRIVTRGRGLAAAFAYADFLVATQRPLDAAAFLRKAARGALDDEARTLREGARAVERRCEHATTSTLAYRAAYASLPDDIVHPKDLTPQGVMSQGRALALMHWANGLPKDAAPSVLFVGVQDGYLEGALLTTVPGMRATIAEVVPNQRAVLGLKQHFGDRVRVHQMRYGLYDWGDEAGYDAVVCFEVLEHVPHAHDALRRLRQLVKPKGGRLFLSTPVADRWEDRDLVAKPPAFCAHLQAYGPNELHTLLEEWGFRGELAEAYDGTFVFDGTRKQPRVYENKNLRSVGILDKNLRSVGILVPGGVAPFDARSAERGHLGGSEEAVIHLSRELAALGHDVVVYAPQAARADAGRIVAKDGVLWKDSKAFDFGDGDEHDVVLFWRCPEAMERKPRGKYRAALWLHDSYYGPTGTQARMQKLYAAADDVVVLSKFHRDCLAAHDGFASDNARVLQNGVAPEEFPAPDEDARDPLRVVYTSSPDRGLANLLDLWPQIQARVPGASLRIYYDWKGARWLKPELVSALEDHLKFLAAYEVPRHDGDGVVKMDVQHVGGVSHAELHDALRKAGVWAYPHDGGAADSDGPSPETFCISAVKACAAGCYPVTTNRGALPEVLCGGVTVNIDHATWKGTFVDEVVARLEMGKARQIDAERKDMRETALARFSWAKTAELFEAALLDVRVK